MDPAWAWRGPIAAEPRNADRRTAGRGAASAARLRERDAPLIFRDRVGDLRAGGYLELGEDLAQVILDRARADEQPRADLGVGQPRAREARDLLFALGEPVAQLRLARARRLARSAQFAGAALGERVR